MFQQPGPLSEVAKQQTCLYKYPGDADVLQPAMPQVRIKGFCSGGAEEHRADNQQSIRVLDECNYCKMRTKSTEYLRIIQDMSETDNGHHGKPDEHNGAKKSSHHGCTKAL